MKLSNTAISLAVSDIKQGHQLNFTLTDKSCSFKCNLVKQFSVTKVGCQNVKDLHFGKKCFMTGVHTLLKETNIGIVSIVLHADHWQIFAFVHSIGNQFLPLEMQFLSPLLPKMSSSPLPTSEGPLIHTT